MCGNLNQALPYSPILTLRCRGRTRPGADSRKEEQGKTVHIWLPFFALRSDGYTAPSLVVEFSQNLHPRDFALTYKPNTP